MRYCGLLLTLLLLLSLLLARLSGGGQQFFDESVPGQTCCDDEEKNCCERADENWENDPSAELYEETEEPSPANSTPYWLSPLP